jgi:hypothetical protein
MAYRNELITAGIDPSVSLGLEIGPLMTPVVSRSMGNIEYLDHTDTDGLRAKYASHRDVRTDEIVEVDHVWNGGTLAETVGAGKSYDYVLASHVIEHVPDLITWMEEIHQILVPNGLLSLAIPDKRRTFDIFRDLTKPADVVDARLRASGLPCPRQIFDHYASAMHLDDRIAWDEDAQPCRLQHVHDESSALAAALRGWDGREYVDVHCWVFTPDSFRSLLGSLQHLGLVRFEVASSHDTVGSEFFICLRAVEQVSTFADTTASQFLDHSEREQSSRRAVTQKRLDQAEVDLEHLDRAEAELADIYGSISWRLTQPLRSMNRRLGLSRRLHLRR